jgi:hypothetical protein
MSVIHLMQGTTRQWMVAGYVLACAAGCSTGGAESVEGVVTLDGTPLPAAYILFIPTQSEIKGPFNGKTDDQGRYSLGPIGDEGGGVPVGTYRVSITTAHSEDAGMEGVKLPPERVPRQYRDGSMQFDVPQGGTTAANFDLKSR